MRVLIPAAGRGKRSGLTFPKGLYRINGVPIIINVCKKLTAYDRNPIIVVNPDDQELFKTIFTEFNINPQFCFQQEAKGMGDAILKSDDLIKDQEDVLLTWSDIPFISPDTIKVMIDCHETCRNDFSFATRLNTEAYTIVERKDGKVTGVIETRAEGIVAPKNAEREIGLFIFNKKIVFDILKKGSGQQYENGVREHGFLSSIGEIALHHKTEGYPIAKEQDIYGFNTQEDLKQIENFYPSVGS